MAYITVDTKLVVLLGTPLRQSVSYLAQNRVYERLGLDYYYIPVEVKSSDQLRTVVAGLKQMNLGGLAVTKPYKETILQYLDGMDETARQMGACNTVVVRDGAWIGYNTDGMGCARSLKEEQGFDPAGKHIFSHIEWHMKGYLIELSPTGKQPELIFASLEEVEDTYSLPTAFRTYREKMRKILNKQKEGGVSEKKGVL